MAEASLRSAVIIPVPEAEPVLNGWHGRAVGAEPAGGVPAHITLLFPFLPAGRIDPNHIASLGAVFSRTESYRFELREIRRFPNVIYIAPDPALPFVQLTQAIVARFPDFPPYEGAFDSITPHLTITEGDDARMDDAEVSVRSRLPISARASKAWLIEELEPEWRRLQTRARFPFRQLASADSVDRTTLT